MADRRGALLDLEAQLKGHLDRAQSSQRLDSELLTTDDNRSMTHQFKYVTWQGVSGNYQTQEATARANQIESRKDKAKKKKDRCGCFAWLKRS